MMLRVMDNSGIAWIINSLNCTFRESETPGQVYVYTPRETFRAVTTLDRVEGAIICGEHFRDLTGRVAR